MRERIAGVGSMLLILVTTWLVRADDAPPSPPTSQPATTQADDDLQERLESALSRLAPPEVREGRREPSDRDRMVLSWLQMLMLADNGLNNDLPAKSAAQRAEAQRKLDTHYKAAWAERARSSAETRAELSVVEWLTREAASLLDPLDRPTTFPSTRANEEDLLWRIEQLPRMMERNLALSAELPYHQKRLTLLDKLDHLNAEPGPIDDARALKHSAVQTLLATTDAAFAAQATVDRLNIFSTTEPATSEPTTEATTESATTRAG